MTQEREALLLELLREKAEEMGAVGVECKFIMQDPDGEITLIMGDVPEAQQVIDEHRRGIRKGSKTC